MWEDDVVKTFAAAVEHVLPGSIEHDLHLRVAEIFDHAMPGFPVLVTSLLDAFADDVAAGAKFADLTAEERDEVFEVMTSDPAPDVSDVINGLFIFTLGQNYTEAHPAAAEMYARLGYHGPSEGEPEWVRSASA